MEAIKDNKEKLEKDMAKFLFSELNEEQKNEVLKNLFDDSEERERKRAIILNKYPKLKEFQERKKALYGK